MQFWLKVYITQLRLYITQFWLLITHNYDHITQFWEKKVAITFFIFILWWKQASIQISKWHIHNIFKQQNISASALPLVVSASLLICISVAWPAVGNSHRNSLTCAGCETLNTHQYSAHTTPTLTCFLIEMWTELKMNLSNTHGVFKILALIATVKSFFFRIITTERTLNQILAQEDS